jgi:hypothetical protein
MAMPPKKRPVDRVELVAELPGVVLLVGVLAPVVRPLR